MTRIGLKRNQLRKKFNYLRYYLKRIFKINVPGKKWKRSDQISSDLIYSDLVWSKYWPYLIRSQKTWVYLLRSKKTWVYLLRSKKKLCPLGSEQIYSCLFGSDQIAFIFSRAPEKTGHPSKCQPSSTLLDFDDRTHPDASWWSIEYSCLWMLICYRSC